MKKKTLKKLATLYLEKYAEKDLTGVAQLFAEDIILRDWKIRVIGKEKALAETQKNFDAANAIEIQVLSMYENKNTVAAELKITVNKTEELYVVDVISFNEHQKISAIRAYLGRGD